ncbi:MAG TPA: hypothetical protein VE219_06890, partial [Candidatus Sulfotelmatobacter sp.]|nr:hypothetical protein [Candidatus Sulfotelmatobacter sp.]
MTPLALGGVWLAVAGTGLAAQLPALRRWVLILPLLAAAAALAAASQASWPGPTSGDGGLALGRVGQGLLAATALATFATLVAGGDVTSEALPSLGLVGAGSVLMLSATTPVVWSVGAVLAVAAMVARWVTAFPSHATLSAGRVAGTGAALLLCAAPLLASTDALLEPRLRLSGALLLFGIGSLLALLPVGGWAPRSLAEVHGADAASWVLIVCPSLLFTTGVTIDHLPPDARYPLDHGLLVAGI